MSRHAAPGPRFTWKDTEPVRLYLYSVLGPLVVLLVALGVVESDQALLWLALAAAVLGVPAVERARSLVTSPATAARHDQDVRDYLADLDVAGAQAYADGFQARPAPRYDDVE
jgi:hypothetical protein